MKNIDLHAEPAPRTTQKQRWLYAATSLGVRLPGQVIAVSLLYFYTDIKRLPPVWASTALAIYAIYNALNNPILGYLQDRKFIGGLRRIPWIKFGALPAMVFFAALWMPPFDGTTHPQMLVVYMFIVLVLFDAFATAVSNAYHALLPEMFVNFRERTGVAARMNIFYTVALLLSVALPLPISKIIGWGPMGILFGLIGLGAIFFGIRGMFENNTAAEPNISFLQALRATILNRSFTSLTLAQAMRFVATQTQAAGTIFFVKYTLGFKDSDSTLVLATVFIVSAAMIYPWRQLIANRREPRTTALLAYVATTIGAASLWFVNSLAGMYVAAVLIGTGFAGIFLMDNILLSEVMDEDEMRSGQRREAMYFGMNSMAAPLGMALVSICFGIITSAYGYNPVLSTQPETVRLGFRIFMTAVPVASCLAAFTLLLAFYPLHGARLRELKRTLAQHRNI